jgi:hypothetical protein
MKTTLTQLVIGSILVLGSLFPGTASAQHVNGKVTLIGNLVESAAGSHAGFRVWLNPSTCGNGDTNPQGRQFQVLSGPMDGEFVHRSATFRSVYNTLLVAFLTGQQVDISGTNFPSCSDPTAVLELNLADLQVTMSQ